MIESGLIIDGLVAGLRCIMFEGPFDPYYIRHCLNGDTFITIWSKDF